MKTLILGAGEVGKALKTIFMIKHEVYLDDIEPQDHDEIEILHIAFPDSNDFIGHVKNYIKQYRPLLTIIHSSVKPGTTIQCGDHVVYSPIRGRHPNLVYEMRNFRKFVAGTNAKDVDIAALFFEVCDWDTHRMDDPTTLETLKLLSNVHMGLEIAWRQFVAGLLSDQRSYRLWEDDYFRGYFQLGQHHMIRPRMRPGPIGGHCILECIALLKHRLLNSKVLDFIMESNEITKEVESCLTTTEK